MNAIIKITAIISLAAATLLSHNAFAVTKKKRAAPVAKTQPVIYGESSLAAVINQNIRNVDPNLNIGVVIQSMKSGRVIYRHNDTRAFVPASILKIMTAEAALLYLGTNYRFPTQFYSDSSDIRNGVLYGNIYLVHSGDPTLTFYNLSELMTSLKARGIQRVSGNVYIDTTAYDNEQYGPGWVWDDTRYCYAAPISASIVNRNCLSFSIAPAKSVGHLANVLQSPRYYYSGIHNSVVTKPSNSRACSLQVGANGDSTISITGCMSKGRYAQGVSTVISNVTEYNKSLVRSLFKRSGIAVTGTVSHGAAPPHLKVLASHHSKPLHQIVNEMLKKSDNIIAGSLFKKVGEAYTQKQGSWESGSYAVSNILSRYASMSTSQLKALDGSGLSRNNLLTPTQMLQVLNFAYHNEATNYEFISGLPVAGVDGTLKNRLRNVAWKVRAKTGTMKGVNSLAGYAITQDKEALAFVIIVNGKNGLGWKYKDLEDKLVVAMTRYKRG